MGQLSDNDFSVNPAAALGRSFGIGNEEMSDKFL
jgi:hypothetical protein